MPESAASPPAAVPITTLVPKSAVGLSVREWWFHVGTDNVLKVIAEMGTSLAYMRHIAYRCKLPSYRFVKAMIQAAERHTPGFAPNLERVLEPIAPRALYSIRVAGVLPSVQFRAHQRYLEAVARGDLPLEMSAEEGEALVARLVAAEEEEAALRALAQQRAAGGEVMDLARMPGTKAVKAVKAVKATALERAA